MVDNKKIESQTRTFSAGFDRYLLAGILASLVIAGGIASQLLLRKSLADGAAILAASAVVPLVGRSRRGQDDDLDLARSKWADLDMALSTADQSLAPDKKALADRSFILAGAALAGKRPSRAQARRSLRYPRAGLNALG
ncbi:hypothetical protein EH165_05425 [Nakamurella antarctica]|uniref:Uncharacterized protein n=1 Tax=Nakamurella antarctica TaxID=1902245 RepID=A0A3G8ZUH5_9ACTN|nr:hypothetical protein [Nakamurella antarctica]AZI57676.1 hypothetical protein EH165_05425 [Nakamurella antarctica]